LLDRPEDGDYVITMPNTYARGILFGKLVLELCDVSTISCPNTDYHCDVDFKAKGWISGGYNVINGHVKGPGNKEIGEITGHWSETVDFHEKKSGTRYTLFDPSQAKIVPKCVLPESEQEENESRRLWSKLTEAIRNADMYGATAAKTAVEDRQREAVKRREAAGESAPEPRFFVHVEGDRWMPKIGVDRLPKDRDEMEKAVRKWIFGDKAPQPNGGSTRGSASGPSPPSPNPPVAAPSGQRNAGSTTAPPPPPAIDTAPGPPVPGPKFDHPVSK